MYTRNSLLLKFILFCILAAGVFPAYGQGPGTPDTGFGLSGKVTVNEQGIYTTEVAVQPDGKIVTAGSKGGNGQQFAVFLRFNSNGTPDTGFGTNGRVVLSSLPYSTVSGLTIQDDGKILACGYSNYTDVTQITATIIRLNTDGSPDATFGNAGIYTATTFQGVLNDLVLQSDGKIIAAGAQYLNGSPTNNYRSALIRVNPIGTADNTFGSNGVVFSNFPLGQDVLFCSAALQSDGKIVVCGAIHYTSTNNQVVVARYEASGLPDASFGTSGWVFTNYGTGMTTIGKDLVIQSSGRIMVAGDRIETGDYLLINYNPNGSLNTAFGTSGTVSSPVNSPYSISLSQQPDGKLITCGNGNNRITVRRFLTSGSPDNTFGTNGAVVSNVTEELSYCGTLQNDGKFVVAGYELNGAYAFVARYNAYCLPKDSTLNLTACGSYSLNGTDYSSSGTYSQTIDAVSGCDSLITLNLTIIQPSQSSITAVACDSFVLNDFVYYGTGNYIQLLENTAGCDSTIYLQLTVTHLDTSVTAGTNLLSANSITGSYQWIDCSSGMPVNGQTSKNFTPLSSGFYKLVLTEGECSDTSGCHYIYSTLGTGVPGQEKFQVWPNPTNGELLIRSTMSEPLNIRIYDATGKYIDFSTSISGELTMLRFEGVKGVYFLEISDEHILSRIKVIKE